MINNDSEDDIKRSIDESAEQIFDAMEPNQAEPDYSGIRKLFNIVLTPNITQVAFKQSIKTNRRIRVSPEDPMIITKVAEQIADIKSDGYQITEVECTEYPAPHLWEFEFYIEKHIDNDEKTIDFGDGDFSFEATIQTPEAPELLGQIRQSDIPGVTGDWTFSSLDRMDVRRSLDYAIRQIRSVTGKKTPIRQKKPTVRMRARDIDEVNASKEIRQPGMQKERRTNSRGHCQTTIWNRYPNPCQYIRTLKFARSTSQKRNAAVESVTPRHRSGWPKDKSTSQ